MQTMELQLKRNEYRPLEDQLVESMALPLEGGDSTKVVVHQVKKNWNLQTMVVELVHLAYFHWDCAAGAFLELNADDEICASVYGFEDG
jgi:hypothetical protein